MKTYISSTFRDLRDYREKAYRTLRKLRHDVLAMEDSVAADKRPLEQCLSDVEAADVYIGIFAWRYGYVPPADNPEELSITELEYRHALECQKKPLIFLLDESLSWPPQYMDSHTGDGGRGQRIQRLRKELEERHSVGFFENPDNLATLIITALLRIEITEPPRALPMSTAPKRAGARASRRKNYSTLWNPGDVLRVRLIDSSPRQRRFVERFVPIWSAYANIQFEFGDDPDAEIRVAFRDGEGSWAYDGTGALNLGVDAATVNFGWITDASLDGEADHTILHEFGHVLGLQHEHLNPNAGIPWDKEAVRRTLQGPPNYWDEERIQQTLYTTWDPTIFPYEKPFDPESIMAYAFPAELTGPAHEMGQNMSLSQGDKEFVQRLYPYL